MQVMRTHLTILTLSLAGLTSLGCDEYTPLGESCGYSTEPSEEAVIVYNVGGGIFGNSAYYELSSDGTVSIVNSLYGDRCEAHLDVIDMTVDELLDDLEETGVYNKDDGCYEIKNEVHDGIGSSLLIRDDSEIRYFSSYEGAGPDDVVDAMTLVGLAMIEVEATCGEVFHPLNTEHWCDFGNVELSAEQALVFDVTDRREDIREGYSVLSDGTVYKGEFPAFDGDIRQHCIGMIEGGQEAVRRLLEDLAETNAHSVEQGCYLPRESVFGELKELSYAHSDEVVSLSTYAEAGPDEITEALSIVAALIEETEFSCD